MNWSFTFGAASGIVLGYFWATKTLGKKLEKVTMLQNTQNEVLFFPDEKTCASDASLSREVKGMLYKEILDYSEPLMRLVEHISKAHTSIGISPMSSLKCKPYTSGYKIFDNR